MVPETMITELFQILQPRINQRVLEIVNERLDDEQIALLLVKLINPYIVLSQEDESKLRGVDRKTLRGMKARSELSTEGVKNGNSPNRPNNGQVLPNIPHDRRAASKQV